MMSLPDSDALEDETTCPDGHETIEHVGRTHYDGDLSHLFACNECGAYWREAPEDVETDEA